MEAADMERLYRSRDDRMLAGVAGGLAEMWDADPALIRIVWALLVIFTGGVALLVYIVMAIVVPEEDDTWERAVPPPPGSASSATEAPVVVPPPHPGATGAPPSPAGAGWVSPPPTARQMRAEARAARRAARGDRAYGTTGGVVLGGLLVLLGAYFLIRQYLPTIDFNWFWPVVLVAVGVLLLLSAVGRGPRSGGPG
jgi:phage shock protein PspC (stress-responsive transcriptional regulator)